MVHLLLVQTPHPFLVGWRPDRPGPHSGDQRRRLVGVGLRRHHRRQRRRLARPRGLPVQRPRQDEPRPRRRLGPPSPHRTRRPRQRQRRTNPPRLTGMHPIVLVAFVILAAILGAALGGIATAAVFAALAAVAATLLLLRGPARRAR